MSILYAWQVQASGTSQNTLGHCEFLQSASMLLYDLCYRKRVFLNKSYFFRSRKVLRALCVRSLFQRIKLELILKITIQVRNAFMLSLFYISSFNRNVVSMWESIYYFVRKCVNCWIQLMDRSIDVSMNYMSETLGIRVHVKGVIGKRASKCPYCDCFFTRNGSDLQQHIWAHEGAFYCMYYYF